MKGLEPPRLAAPDPKSGVATNYTTSADAIQIASAKIIIIFKNKKMNKKTYCLE